MSSREQRTLEWAAKEVYRQHDSALFVPGMFSAVQYAQNVVDRYDQWWFPAEPRINVLFDIIDNIACYVKQADPVWKDLNNPWRNIHLTVNNTLALAPSYINRSMRLLLENKDDLTATEFYTLFEQIHPYTDGNGRVGAILYNLHGRTIQNPITPPNVFGEE